MTRSRGIRLKKQLKKNRYSDKTIDEILKWYLHGDLPQQKPPTTKQKKKQPKPIASQPENHSQP